jgi:hypothetical protein
VVDPVPIAVAFVPSKAADVTKIDHVCILS